MDNTLDIAKKVLLILLGITLIVVGMGGYAGRFLACIFSPGDLQADVTST